MSEKQKENKSVTGEVFDFYLLKRILGLSGPYKKQMLGAYASTVLLAVMSPIRPWIIQHTLNSHVANFDANGLTQMTILLVALLLIQTLIQFWNTYITSWIGQGVIKDMRMKVFKHISSLRLPYFDRTPVGTLVTRNVNDIETINDLFSDGIITIAGDILQIIAITFAMFYMDWKLSLVTLSVLPLLFYASHIFRIKVKKSFQDVRTQVARLNAFVQERITGMQIVQIFGREKEEYEKFRAINKEHYLANKRGVLYYSIFFPVIEVITAISLGLLVWWGTKTMLQHNAPDFGTVTAFILFINMFFRPIRVLADRFNTIQMGMVAAERIFKLLDDKTHIENEGKNDAGKFEGQVVFKNVWFAYEADNYVLKDINFSLNSGETLAIVGPTGAGKSSIINLLSRFYSINKGEIEVDGKNINDFTLSSLRKNISVVLQDVFLFSGSIKENISLNNPDISDDKVVEAAKMVGAHDFIMQLPGNYNYNVMERGSTLSLGQRQLISFARALASNPSILILDEATSSIDTETEELLQQATRKLMAGRTSIVIAHRLSTIQHADRIMVLQKGLVAEAGTHSELLAKSGLYKELYDSQLSELVG